jgi:hypothetical protein
MSVGPTPTPFVIEYGVTSFPAPIQVVIVNPGGGDPVTIDSNLFTAQDNPIYINEGAAYEAGPFDYVSPFFISTSAVSSTTLAPGATRNLAVSVRNPDRSGNLDEEGDFLEAGTHRAVLVVTHDGFKSVLPQVQAGIDIPNVLVSLVITPRLPTPTINGGFAKVNGRTSSSIIFSEATLSAATSEIDGFAFEVEYTILDDVDLYGSNSSIEEMLAANTWVTENGTVTVFRDGDVYDNVHVMDVTRPTASVVSISGGNVAFGGLLANRNYTVFARIKGSQNYLPGAYIMSTDSTLP